MRRATVEGAGPAARISASQRSSASVVASPTRPSSHAATCARSRRYASTVRGARELASRSRKTVTSRSATSGSGVGEVIDLPQALGVDVAIDLRGRERGVAEELLDRAQVGAALEQVRGEGVPQPVGVGEHPANRARVEPPAADGEEEGVLGAAREARADVAQVEPEQERRLFAERHSALLASLPADEDEFLLEVHVGEVEADCLRAPQPGGV